MGCVCSKGILANEKIDKETKLSKSSKRFVSSFKRDEVVVEADGTGNDATALLTSSPGGVYVDNEREKKAVTDGKSSKTLQRRGTMDTGVTGRQEGKPVQSKISRVGSMPHGERGAQIVAGWPSWLSSVAGEAINGWVPRRADSFEKLEKIGQGTYSSVYKARDLETNKIVALKKVRFANMDPESVRFMAREIVILRRLDHPNVMKLEALITSRVSGSLYLVFEYMEHDLAGLAASPGVKFNEAQIKCYMRQLLRGLEHCHKHGVLHRDIKGANLLIDNHGTLKIGDFGLATAFQPHQKQPLTSRVVTLWYRPPELLLGSTEYGPSVDLWSSGCILAELFAGKPIMPGRTEVEQLHKIFKLCGSPSEAYWKNSKLPHATIFKPQQPYERCLAETFKHFPLSTLALLDILLAVEPDHRGSASSALQHEFFTTKPLPLNPSSLPKYPPSKEFDAKLRDDEARRRKAALKGRQESFKKNPKESRAIPAPDANAELPVSIQVGSTEPSAGPIEPSVGLLKKCFKGFDVRPVLKRLVSNCCILQKRQGQNNPKSTSEKYNKDEDGGSGFPIEPPRGTATKGSAHSGQLTHRSTSGSSRIMDVKEDEVLVVSDQEPDSSINGSESRNQRSYVNRAAAQLSKFSSSVAVRGSSRFDGQGFNGRYNPLDGGESSGVHNWSHHLLVRPNSSYKKDTEDSGKDHTMVYSPQKNRIHYSGPLLRPGGNIDEMLKEHEKQIQHAVRKARIDRAKTNSDPTENGLTEALLQYGKNGR